MVICSIIFYIFSNFTKKNRSSYWHQLLIIYYPHSYDYYFFPFRVGRRIVFSFCLSVRLSVTKSCPFYYLITVIDILMKLHTFVKHMETICHALEP